MKQVVEYLAQICSSNLLVDLAAIVADDHGAAGVWVARRDTDRGHELLYQCIYLQFPFSALHNIAAWSNLSSTSKILGKAYTVPRPARSLHIDWLPGTSWQLQKKKEVL